MPWAAAQQPQPAGHDGDPGGEARRASSPRARCDLPNLARGRAGWAWNWIEVLWHAVLHRALLRLVGGMAPSCTGPTMPGQRGRGRDRWTIGARRQRPAARPARADMSSETPHPDPASALAPEAPAPEPVPAEAATPQEAPAPLVAADAVEAAVDAEAEVEVEVESVAPMAAAAPATEQARMSLEACTVELRQRFPALFGGGPKPIKLRIQVDIQARAPGVFTRPALSAFLRRLTGSTSYLLALGKATQRLDLDGQPAGEISAEHHEAARQELARRRELRRQREQAMRAPQGPQSPQQAQPTAAAGPDAAGTTPPVDRPPRADRPPRRDRDAQRRPQPGQHARPPQPARPGRPEQAGRSDRPAGQQHPPQPPRPPRPPHESRTAGPADALTVAPAAAPRPAPAQPPEDPGRRERWLLLRAFDGSPLTKSNFCALKGMTVEHLDAQLLLARQEAAAWAAANPNPNPNPNPNSSPRMQPERGFQGSRDPRGAPRRGPR